MRILLLTGLFPNRVNPHRGVYILRQAMALKQWAEVKVIAPVPYFPAFIKSKKYSPFTTIPDRDVIEGINVIYPRYFIIPKVFRFLHGIFLTYSVLGPFREVISEFRPDVVVGFFAFPYGFATVQLARMFRVPVAIGVLGSDVNIMARSGLRRLMIRWCLNTSDKVFSVSGALRDTMVGLGVHLDKIVVIPNGVDPSRFPRMTRSEARARLGLRDSRRTVLCVANLVHVKGLDLVIRAFCRLRDADAVLFVIGDGEKRDELGRMVRELELEQRVRFLGPKPPSEVPLWMAASDLVVLGSRAEGHPNVVVEAMASGRPVVATRVGGIPETITSEDLGLIVEPEDPDAMARAILAALSRQWNEDAIRRAGLARTWTHVAEEITTELQKLITCGPRHGERADEVG